MEVTTNRQQEDWRPVPLELFSHLYEVSSLGRIRRAVDGGHRGSWKAGRVRALTPAKKYGHVLVNLYNNNVIHAEYVHRLVALAFIGPPPSARHEVRHINGNASDNRVDNLAWGTSADNTEDCRKHGTLVVGSKHPLAKLTEIQITEIRDLRKQGHTTVELAKMFGVGRQRIGKICSNKVWKHVE